MQIPNLRQWRELRGFTQQELSERAGVSVRGVAGYEAGAPIRPNTARKLAEALDVTVMDLAGVDAIPKDKAPTTRQPSFNDALAEDRRTEQFHRARQNLAEVCEPWETKIAAGDFTGQDTDDLRRQSALIAPLLQVALEAEAHFLREQYPDEEDVGPRAILGPAIVRFVQLVHDTGGEMGEGVRELEQSRKAAYSRAA